MSTEGNFLTEFLAPDAEQAKKTKSGELTSPPWYSSREKLLRHYARHDMSMHVGEAEIAAIVTIGQLLVIEAEQMQHRGVKIVHVNFVSDGCAAEFVRRAINCSASHSAA